MKYIVCALPMLLCNEILSLLCLLAVLVCLLSDIVKHLPSNL